MTADSLFGELVATNKRAWIIQVVGTFPGFMPHYKALETGQGFDWTRKELLPVIQARTAKVRMVGLKLMAGAKKG